MAIIYSALFAIGILGSRVYTIGARGGVEHQELLRAGLGALATLVSLSLIVWGFAALPWYWPIGTFLIGSICAGLAITRTNWASWYTISPILDLIATGGGLYLWIRHWPF